MRLKTNIFLWVATATVVPLTVLVFGAALFSEAQYRRDVDHEEAANLDNLVSDIDRRLRIERGMIVELTQVAPLIEFLPVVVSADLGDTHPQLQRRRLNLARFLGAFQVVVPSLRVIRVLDLDGNTLLRAGQDGNLEADLGGPLHLERPIGGSYRARLAQLPRHELSIIDLPYPRDDRFYSPMLDAVQPLQSDGRVVGYLVVSMWGSYTDQILDYTPRPRGGELLIAELNPDDPVRDGRILYDDVSNAGFARLGGGPERIQDYFRGGLWDAVQLSPYGVIDTPGKAERIYFVEYHPYPGQLISWVLANRVDVSSLIAPFERIRIGILLFAGVALIASMVVARLGARQVSKPVAELSRVMKEYAHGRTDVQIHDRGPDEIRDLQASFLYLAETQSNLEEERDRARALVIQNAKLAGVGQLAAGIAHEINNPISNILSLVKLAERELPPNAESAREDITGIRDEAIRTSRIVQGLLNFSRQVPPRFTDFEIRPWIEESLALVRQVAMKRGVRCAIEQCDESQVQGDRNQLQQVLINLLVNAAQATDSGGTVIVRADRDEQSLNISVRDTGPGLAEEIRDKIFDPFFTTKAVGEGSGLGLSISLGIVQAHGGQLSLNNHPDGGVIARIHLPLTSTLTDTDDNV